MIVCNGSRNNKLLFFEQKKSLENSQGF